MSKNKNIFVTGIPRSGTTWLAKVLTSGGDYKYIHEPDNERHTYTGYYWKQDLPRFPFVLPGDPNADKIRRLFHEAFFSSYFGMGSFSNKVLYKLSRYDKEKLEKNLQVHGVNPPNQFGNVKWLYPFLPKEVKRNEPRLVKSVHSILSTDLIMQEFDVKPVIIIRHPASIISSCLQMDNPDMDRKIYENQKLLSFLFKDDLPDFSQIISKESKAALQVAIFYKFISHLEEKHKDIVMVTHEQLAAQPINEFQSLYAKLDLDFNENVVNFINKNNKSGKGYDINRVASDTIDVWKKRLEPGQIDDIILGYNCFTPSYYTDFN